MFQSIKLIAPKLQLLIFGAILPLAQLLILSSCIINEYLLCELVPQTFDLVSELDHMLVTAILKL